MCSAWAVAPRCWSTTDEPAKAARSLKDPQETRDRRAAAADRRRRRELRLRERRSGFERRSVDSSGLRLAYDRALVVYRADSVRFWTVLATIVVFNFLDLMLTIRSLDRGAIALNPLDTPGDRGRRETRDCRRRGVDAPTHEALPTSSRGLSRAAGRFHRVDVLSRGVCRRVGRLKPLAMRPFPQNMALLE